MSKLHIGMFHMLVATGIVALIATTIIGNLWFILVALAFIGVIIYGYGVASEYAIWGKYYRDVYPINEDIIKNYQELRENLEKQIKCLELQIKNKEEYHRDCEIQRAKLLANAIIDKKIIEELLHDNNSIHLIYASRWMTKREEIINLIEASDRNHIDEIFDSLIKLRNEIESGVVDINRD